MPWTTIRIIDALDDVADDAIQHKGDIKPGLALVAKMEKEALPVLQGLKTSRRKTQRVRIRLAGRSGDHGR